MLDIYIYVKVKDPRGEEEKRQRTGRLGDQREISRYIQASLTQSSCVSVSPLSLSLYSLQSRVYKESTK